MIPVISIIIPTYNRADLLGQTLDSIRNQTFDEWECLVIDDGSTDWTDELMEFYCERDKRIKYFHRSVNYSKGANSCRNIGLEMSCGEFIQFFDSDDLMLPEALFVKIQKIVSEGSDFVVAKLVNFLPDRSFQKQYYNRSDEQISLRSFLFRETNWMTPDPLLRKSIIELHLLRFNERMNSDQEYNFYCKLLACTENGSYLEDVLTERRIHSNSIQGGLVRSSMDYRKELFKNRYLTFLDLEGIKEKDLREEFLNQLMTIYYLNINKRVFFPLKARFFFKIFCHKGIAKSLLYTGALASNVLFKKGYRLLQYSKRRN